MIKKTLPIILIGLSNIVSANNPVTYFINVKTNTNKAKSYKIQRSAKEVKINDTDLGIGAIYTLAELWGRLDRFRVNTKYKCSSGEFRLSIIREQSQYNYRSCLDDVRAAGILKEVKKISL